MSDEQWALIEPVLTAWKSWHRSVSGHQGRYPMREIVNSILYRSRTGSPTTSASARPELRWRNSCGSRDPWMVEECFQTAKNETSLDHYQVRGYTAWYRHITLSMAALAFLAILRVEAEKGISTSMVIEPSYP
jgi:transposase